MKLFRRGGNPPKKVVEVSVPWASELPLQPPPVPPVPPPAPRKISLNAEQKSLLEKPVDPRVDKILQEIYADKTEAERALKTRRIIDFPHGDSGERHIIQDERGFWRIVPGPASEQSISLLDAL